jgi:hypothetical protein
MRETATDRLTPVLPPRYELLARTTNHEALIHAAHETAWDAWMLLRRLRQVTAAARFARAERFR